MFICISRWAGVTKGPPWCQFGAGRAPWAGPKQAGPAEAAGPSTGPGTLVVPSGHGAGCGLAAIGELGMPLAVGPTARGGEPGSRAGCTEPTVPAAAGMDDYCRVSLDLHGDTRHRAALGSTAQMAQAQPRPREGQAWGTCLWWNLPVFALALLHLHRALGGSLHPTQPHPATRAWP